VGRVIIDSRYYYSVFSTALRTFLVVLRIPALDLIRAFI